MQQSLMDTYPMENLESTIFLVSKIAIIRNGVWLFNKQMQIQGILVCCLINLNLAH